MIKDELKKLLGKDFAGKIDHPNVEKFGDFSVRGDFNLKEDGELIEKN